MRDIRAIILYLSWKSRLSTSDQLIVVCGRNTTLASELARQNWDIQVVVKVRKHSYSCYNE